MVELRPADDETRQSGAPDDELIDAAKREVAAAEIAADKIGAEAMTKSVRLSEKPGTVIGRYKLLQQIGEGGFGVVYMAEQTEPVHRRVAFKVIKLGMDTHQVIARFEAERQALAMMDHPNIAKVLDAGATEKGRPYFVMELVKGIPITQYCDQKNLGFRDRLTLFMQVCHAVQHAHQKGIIHRDIKPSNVMVTHVDDKPVPKVIDFGIAKATQARLTEQTMFTQFGQFIGTPAYMSPEQADPIGADVDTRSDIYSLGVLLYELLTGTLPFDAATLRRMGFEEIKRIIREVDPPRPSTRVGSLRSDAGLPEPSRDPERDRGGSVPQPDFSDPSRDREGAESFHPSRDREGAVSEHAPTRDPKGAEAFDQNADSEETKLRAVALTTDQPVDERAVERPLPDGRGSVEAIARSRRTDPRSLVRQLRGDLDWIIMKALEKDRTRRYETANGLAADIERYLNNEPVLAGPPTATYRLGKFVRRNRAGVLAGSLVVTALILGLIGTGIMYLRAEDARHRAVLAEQQQSRAREEAVRERERAEEQRERADQARADAEQRSRELAEVAEFQAAKLSDIDAQRMGLGLRDDILADARSAMQRDGADQDAIAAFESSFRDMLAKTNMTSVVLKALDREFFQRSITSIQEKFADQPLVKAHLLQTVANTLRDVGLLDQAMVPQEEALRLRREHLGNDNPTTLQSVFDKGNLLAKCGRLADGERMGREALDGFRRVLTDCDGQTLNAMRWLAWSLQAQNRDAEAEPYYREIMETYRRCYDADDLDSLYSIYKFGFILHQLGRLSDAEIYYREALQGQRRVLGVDHIDTLGTLFALGQVLQEQGKQGEAELCLREALKRSRSRPKSDDFQTTLRTANLIASILKSQGNASEAELRMREALDITRAHYGDQHGSSLFQLVYVGEFLQETGKFVDAEATLLEAHELLVAGFGEGHERTLNCVGQLVKLYDAWHEAEPGKGYDAKAAEWRARLGTTPVKSEGPGE